MIKERVLKNNFKPVIISGNGVDIYWDCKPEVLKYIKQDNEIEVIETEYYNCIKESFENIPTIHQIKTAILNGAKYYNTLGTISEIEQILIELNFREEQMMLCLKELLIAMIELHDSSINVNQFMINDELIWLDKNTRVGLRLRFESEKNIGLTETTLWYNHKSFTLDIDTALQILF